MHGVLLDGHPRRAFHDQLIILRVGPGAVQVAERLRGADESIADDAPGLHALQAHELAGRLRRAIPLGLGAGREAAAERGHRITRAVAAAGAEHAAARPHAGTVLVELDSSRTARAVLPRLTADPHVRFATGVPARHLLAVGLGAHAAELVPPLRLWNLAAIGLDAPRDHRGAFPSARAIRVAVLDTGVDQDHPALAGRIHDYVHGWPDHGRGATGHRDLVGHGTHVTGIIAGAHRPEMGVRGICGCRPTVFKVFEDVAQYDEACGAYVYTVDPLLYRRALAECAEREIQVVNLSVGGVAKPDPHEQELYERLLQQGAVLVASAGNSRQRGSPTMYPAALEGVIAVGATDLTDGITPFSNRGAYLALCAPGVSIWSTLPMYPGQFLFRCARRHPPTRGEAVRRNIGADAWLGTSSAAPHVSASAALLLARRGRLDGDAVRRRLMAAADRVPGMHGRRFTPDFGAGRLNLRRLLAR